MSISGHSSSPIDVLVIGAGQAGLAMGYQLMRTGFRFLLVDRHERVGDKWRERFDSLVLFTPRAYSALPGLAVPGDPDGYPTKDEIASYLESYARHFALPLELNTEIERLECQDDGFRATTSSGKVLTSRAVVLATGAFQVPAIPHISQDFSSDVVQLSPDSYRNPEQVPSGTVLVVGDGATGRQIARELAPTRRVLLATGRPRRVSPERVLGKSTFWWMDRLGVLRKSRESAIGRYLMRTDPFPGTELKFPNLKKEGVQIVPRVSSVDGQKVVFANGESSTVDSVIWATGYRDDVNWISVPGVADQRGNFIHERGVSPVRNLFFIGRSWQWTRGSALLVGVGDDAMTIVEHLNHNLSKLVSTSVSRERQSVA